MDNQPIKKTGKGAKIACVVLAVLLVGALTYGAVATVQGQQKAKENNDLRDDVAAKDAKLNEIKEQIGVESVDDVTDEEIAEQTGTLGYITENNHSVIALTKKGEVYVWGGMYTKQGTNRADGTWNISVANENVGTIGKYTLIAKSAKREAELETYYVLGDEGKDEFVIEQGVKVNVSNIVSVAPIGWGQAYFGDMYALVGKDGKVSILFLQYKEEKQFTAVLEKDLAGYNNIATAMTILGGDGQEVILITRSGGQVLLDYKILEKMTHNN